MADIPQKRPASLIEFGQLTAITAPFLYLIGQKFAAGYFNQFGCAWAAKFLTFQETLNYALPTSLFVLIGAVLAYALLASKASHRLQAIVLAAVPALIITILFLLPFFFQTPANLITQFINIWLCMTFGFYAVDAIRAYTQPQNTGFKDALCVALASAFVVFGLSSSIGSMIATSELERIDTRFPRIAVPGVVGATTEHHLIAKVGEKFLIREGTGGKPNFYLKENLDAFKILPVHNPSM